MRDQMSSLFSQAAVQSKAQWCRDVVALGFEVDETISANSSSNELLATYKRAWTEHHKLQEIISKTAGGFARDLAETSQRRVLIGLFMQVGIEPELAAKIVDEEIVGHSLH